MLEPSSISQNAAGNRYAVWGSVVITAILYYLRFGYDVGFSDQDEFLPLVLQWLNPSLLQQDWFVQMQASTFTIRSGFAGVVLIISKLTSLQAAVLSIHLLTGALLALVLVRLANRLYHNNIASLLFVVIVLVLTPRWNPGGNDIFHSMLVPSSVSWTLSLWSFDFLTRDRLKKAGWLSALSMAIHPLVGLQLGSIFGASLLLSGQKRPQRFLLPFLLVALPSIYFFAEPFSPPAPLSFDAFSTDPAFASSTSILASIRAPHHYLAHTFPILSWFKWLSILGVGGIVIWRDKIFYSSGMMRDAVVKIAAICLGVIGIGGVFTTIIPLETVIKVQPFNLAVLVRVLGALGIAAWCVSWIPNKLASTCSKVMSTIYFPISAGFVLVAIILASTHALLPDQQTNPQSAQQPASQPYGGPQLGPETAQWIRRNTDINAVFAIPPSLSGFQIQAQRAQYVNFKAFPFSKTEVREWIRRLQVVAPVESFTPGGALLLARLDSSYLSQTPDEWNYAQVQANIDYLVRPATNDEDWPTENADWCTFKWCVYALPIPFDTSN